MAVRTERIGDPVGLHERRVLAWLRSSAGDALAGRRMWCAATLSGGRAAGRRLHHLLEDDLDIGPLAVEATEPPAQLARAGELAEPSLGGSVRPGVVVLHDWFTVSFAAALLDRGGTAAVDAVVVDERAGVGGPEGVTALVPASRISLLGDVVEEDRADHVGGTIRARPVVAAR